MLWQAMTRLGDSCCLVRACWCWDPPPGLCYLNYLDFFVFVVFTFVMYVFLPIYLFISLHASFLFCPWADVVLCASSSALFPISLAGMCYVVLCPLWLGPCPRLLLSSNAVCAHALLLSNSTLGVAMA